MPEERREISPAIVIVPLVLGLGAVAALGMAALAAGPTPPPPGGAADLVYVSDIRQQPGSDEYGRAMLSFSIDIKNTGSTPQVCTPTAFIETSYGTDTVPMGSTTINPGQTVTFEGTWTWTYGGGGAEGEWWRASHILSEAGAISFLVGRQLYFDGVDIPLQITSGSEFWATQTLHLPAGNHGFGCALWLRPQRVGRQIYGSFGLVITGAWPYGDILLTETKDYSIRGVYVNQVSTPAVASYYDPVQRKTVLLQPGTYDLISQVNYYRPMGGDNPGFVGPCWSEYVVGQVEVV